MYMEVNKSLTHWAILLQDAVHAPYSRTPYAMTISGWKQLTQTRTNMDIFFPWSQYCRVDNVFTNPFSKNCLASTSTAQITIARAGIRALVGYFV